MENLPWSPSSYEFNKWMHFWYKAMFSAISVLYMYQVSKTEIIELSMFVDIFWNIWNELQNYNQELLN